MSDNDTVYKMLFVYSEHSLLGCAIASMSAKNVICINKDYTTHDLEHCLDVVFVDIVPSISEVEHMLEKGVKHIRVYSKNNIQCSSPKCITFDANNCLSNILIEGYAHNLYILDLLLLNDDPNYAKIYDHNNVERAKWFKLGFLKLTKFDDIKLEDKLNAFTNLCNTVECFDLTNEYIASGRAISVIYKEILTSANHTIVTVGDHDILAIQLSMDHREITPEILMDSLSDPTVPIVMLYTHTLNHSLQITLYRLNKLSESLTSVFRKYISTTEIHDDYWSFYMSHNNGRLLLPFLYE